MINPPLRRNTAKSIIIELLQTVAKAALVFVLINTLLGRFVIEQTSMEPNFHAGQRVAVSRFGSLWSDLFVSTAHAAGQSPAAPAAFQRGQIVVFHDRGGTNGDPLIKRLIGLPGDTIAIHDGYVWLNGAQLDEPYARDISTTCSACGTITLGDGDYYVLGDNRAVSRDSRSFGPVQAEQFVGRVIVRYWPLGDLSVFP